MKRNTAEQMKRETPVVVPLHDGERVFYVDTVVLVPHRYTVAVPAASAEAACRLAEHVIKSGKAYGSPDFNDRGAIHVAAITSEGRGEPGARVHSVPALFRQPLPARVSV